MPTWRKAPVGRVHGVPVAKGASENSRVSLDAAHRACGPVGRIAPVVSGSRSRDNPPRSGPTWFGKAYFAVREHGETECVPAPAATPACETAGFPCGERPRPCLLFILRRWSTFPQSSLRSQGYQQPGHPRCARAIDRPTAIADGTGVALCNRRFMSLAMDPSGADLFTALRLFRPWPHPLVQCPRCDDTSLCVVEIRVVHGTRESVIDAYGVRSYAAATRPGEFNGLSFALEITFHCHAHESVLRITPEAGGSLRALVEVAAADPSRIPIIRAFPTRAKGGGRRVLRHLRPRIER
jgi:hypothetical protein